MSSDDFGTVNLKRSDRAREIEVMREHYRRHREALSHMAAEAPTEYLAGEYRRLIHEIEISLGKLDELEGRVAAAAAVGGAVPPAPRPVPKRTEPGQRPITPSSSVASPPHPADDFMPSSQSRIILIVVAGLLVLGAIGWLIWRASSEERPVDAVVTETAVSETIAPASPPAGASALTIEPPTHDYGVVRKGTRAARQFEVVNTTDAPISIKVARSSCRCLYYDYGDVVPPKGRETLTVTVDGAKAEEGQLQEAITVSSSGDAAVSATFNVTATIR